jgi:hypothetical protein
VVQETNTSGCTTELWSTGRVSGGAAGVTVTLAASLNAVAIVLEASGLGTSTNRTAGDQDDFGIDPAVASGVTALTTSTNQLWVAGLGGLSTAAYDAPTNGFTETNEQAGTGIELALETKIVSAIAEAYTTATPNPVPLGGAWAGVIGTFGSRIPLVLPDSAALDDDDIFDDPDDGDEDPPADDVFTRTYRARLEPPSDFDDNAQGRVCFMCHLWCPGHALSYVDGKPVCSRHNYQARAGDVNG